MNLENEFRKQIVVGLRLGENSQNILRVAESLGKTLGTNVHAVHILEQMTSLAYSYPNVFSGYDVSGWIVEQQERAIASAEEKLKDLASKGHNPEIVSTAAVLSPDIPSALLAESHNASLLVIGVDHYRYNYIPKGLSVVLSTLAASATPILVVRSDSKLDFRQGYKMLLTDDIAPASLSIVNQAMAFALASGARTLTHAHFLSPTMEKIETVRTADATGKWPDYEDFVTRAKRGIDSLLKTRAQSFTERFQIANCDYKTHVSSGSVGDQIEALIKADRQDIVVFGRPALSRFKPFALGRLAINTIFAGAEAALIIPPS